MGARGPQKGFKQAKLLAKQEGAATPLSSIKPPKAAPEPKPAKAKAPAPAVAKAAAVVLSSADRENPDKLTGDDLRALAHRRGMARSSLPGMSDEKIRLELRYITTRQYEEATA